MSAIVFLTVLIVSPIVRAQATRPTGSDIAALIESLAEPDPAARQAAADRLIALGADARSALLEAIESENPAIRARASELLQELPWFRENDPAEVKEILARYGALEEGQRLIAAGRLAALDQHMGHEALLRLSTEEPSERVRWLVVSILREYSMFGDAKARLRQLDADSTHSAIVLLAGWGWWHIDTARSHALFERAVELESRNWRQPNEEIATAISVLIDDATARGDFNRAAELVRRKIPFLETDNEPIANPHLELLALHAEYGPLPGLASDLRALSPNSNRREILYAAARLCERWSCYPASAALVTAALALAPGSHEEHLAIADFLSSRQWYPWAETEYQAAIARTGDENETIVDAAILFRLSRLASEQQRDAEAADQMEKAMQLVAQTDDMFLHRRGQAGNVADNLVWAEIHWRRFRAARAAHDAAEADKHLAELLRLGPTDIEIAIDVVPILKENNRPDEARKLFDAAYATLKELCDKEPDNPEHQNNLAWLCARAGERLDEALELSMSATQAAPENYAYLDTAAEAHFRLGNAAEAVKLEEKALKFRPRDAFMIEQLHRFRGGL